MPHVIRGRRTRLFELALFTLGLTGALPLDASALTTSYSDPTAFASALPGAAQVRNFENVGLPTIPSGGSVSGLVFSYSLPPASLQVRDTNDTVSGSRSLGLDGLDSALLDGDALSISVSSPVHAIGLYVITSDAASTGEIQIDTAAGSASTGGAPLFVLADGGHVYFLGLVSDTTFSQADLDFSPDGEVNFTYSVDDVATAVPEPASSVLLLAGSAFVFVCWGRRGSTPPGVQPGSIVGGRSSQARCRVRASESKGENR